VALSFDDKPIACYNEGTWLNAEGGQGGARYSTECE
jgi:hypothetical protein